LKTSNLRFLRLLVVQKIRVGQCLICGKTLSAKPGQAFDGWPGGGKWWHFEDFCGILKFVTDSARRRKNEPASGRCAGWHPGQGQSSLIKPNQAFEELPNLMLQIVTSSCLIPAKLIENKARGAGDGVLGPLKRRMNHKG
jgi:hypothetical protein